MSIKSTLQSIAATFSKKEKAIFLILTVAAGIIALWPQHNFQHYLSMGDHGRDLYCFKKVLDGQLPYRDFSWLFGPLMPYYYGICYLLGGISIQSVLMGQMFLTLLTGVFIYLSCATFLSGALSFVCAYWYWAYRGTEFFYTYNHSGGILAIVIALFCALRYIRDKRNLYIFGGFISVYFLMLIRLNMGAFVLIALAGSLLIIDFVQKVPDIKKRRHMYLYLSLATLAAAAILYGVLLRGLPDYAVYQSFPYSKIQRTDPSASVWETFRYAWHLISTYFTATSPQRIFGFLLGICLFQTLIIIGSRKSPEDQKKETLLILAALLFFLVFASHEYLASGVYYRLFWIYPLMYMLVFFLVGIGSRNIRSPFIKLLIAGTFLLPAFWNIQHVNRSINNFKRPLHNLKVGQNNIYTLQHPRWFLTVHQATDFLKKNSQPEDKVLVMPFDPLYLFLSGRDSATRQLVFFDHIHISEEQELATIKELQRPDAKWAVITSRSHSVEGGMGTFGKTYCLKIAQYLEENFETVATFGDWANPAGWAWNHGVKILKRR